MPLKVPLAALLSALLLQQPKPPERVFRFNWPVGTEIHVESERSRERTGDETIAPVPIRTSQRIRVLHHADGRFIQFDESPASTPSPSVAG